MAHSLSRKPKIESIENQMLCFDGSSSSQQTQNKNEHQMFWFQFFISFILFYFHCT